MRAFVMVLVCVASMALVGCTVPPDGLTGVTVSPTGDLMIVVAWCQRPPDGFTVYHLPDVTDVEYEAPPLNGDHVTVGLLSPGDGWTARHSAPAALDPQIEYFAYSWTKGNSYSTEHVSFHADVTQTLHPDEVLYGDADDLSPDRIISMNEFTKRAMAYC